MWRLIDKEMHLKECSIYAYAPEEDLWESDEGVIWSLNYFFFNKARKRVCYVFLRGLSLNSHGSAAQTPISPEYGNLGDTNGFASLDDIGASKRASFWLGDRAPATAERLGRADDVDEVWNDGEEPRLLSPKMPRTFVRTADESGSPFSERSRDGRSRSKSAVRGMSENVTETLEV